MEEHARRWGHDVTLTNTTDDTAVLGVAGPKSRDLLSKLTSTDLSNKAFPFMTSQKLTLAGVDIMALRISYTGKKQGNLNHRLTSRKGVHQFRYFLSLMRTPQFICY